MVNLIVIEAPGKIEAFTLALGRGWRVFATKGHFVQNPERLRPLYIDRRFKETARIPDPVRLEELKKAICGVSGVYLATDADDEGEVIAADVARVAREKDLYRVIVRDLDHETIRAAVRNAVKYKRRDTAGTTRRIIDRILGGVFSKNGGCGRVLSPLLASIERGDETYCELSGPWSYGETLLALRRELNIPVQEGAKRLQKLYEGGLLSYPRTAGRGFSPETQRDLILFARRRNMPPTLDLPAATGSEVHEGLHPTRRGLEMVTLGPDPKNLPGDSAVLSVLARNLVFCMRGGDVPWTFCRHERRPLAPDEILLAKMLRLGLGRPSTLASHVSRIIDDRLVETSRNGGLALSPKGRRWVDATPSWLKDVGYSISVENAINQMSMVHKPARAIISNIVSLLPLDAQEQIIDAISRDETSVDNQERETIAISRDS